MLMKRKHYNTTTLNIITFFVLYKNVIMYPHNEIFTIFTNYLVPILLTTYYLDPTYYKLFKLHTYYLLPNLPNFIIIIINHIST